MEQIELLLTASVRRSL